MTEERHINPWLIAVAVMFATFMEVLDTTVVNVSLPHIAGSLSSTIDEATWALTSYLVANAIILPMTGWLASVFGRKNLLMLSVVGFTAASFLCGLAPTLGSLIFFRILQGATGGALQPLSQAVLLEAFPPHDRGKAMAFWALGIVVAPILGTGARRMADRQLQLAVGVLHQHSGRHRIDRDDQALHLRSAVPAGRVAQGRLLGHRHAGGRHRRAAVRARQGAGRRLVLVTGHSDAVDHRRRHAGRAWSSIC